MLRYICSAVYRPVIYQQSAGETGSALHSAARVVNNGSPAIRSISALRGNVLLMLYQTGRLLGFPSSTVSVTGFTGLRTRSDYGIGLSGVIGSALATAETRPVTQTYSLKIISVAWYVSFHCPKRLLGNPFFEKMGCRLLLRRHRIHGHIGFRQRLEKTGGQGFSLHLELPDN
jgi:hypothetical protein